MLRVLIAEYKKSLRLANMMMRDLDNKEKTSRQDDEDKKIISNMISDMEYAIDWMTIGRNPDIRRGADKKGVYLTDPSILDVLPVLNVDKSVGKDLSTHEKELIEDALCTLTDREKEVFMMIKVEGLTFEYTADLLGVKKSTIQTHFERALRKIENRKKESLFFVS